MVLSTCTSATFASWATDVTNCTNPTFNNVLTSSWSNSNAQKNVLTVLRAITKVIQDRGGKESSTEYYASLLTALNTPSETKAAEAYLLRLVVCKSLPDDLLRSTFSEASKIIVHALDMCLSSETDDVMQLKSLLVCLGHLLRAQPLDAWSLESVRHMYRHLLRFVDHEKPAIRKAIHGSLCAIMQNGQVGAGSSRFHPACHQTVDHLCTVLRKQARQLIVVLCTQDNHCTRLLHCLELLTSILHLLPPKEVKTACECILELVEFPNPLVVTKLYDCFRVLFDNRPLLSLPLDLAARLLTALHSFRPSDPAVFGLSAAPNSSTAKFTGVDVLLSWCKAIWAGCAYLSYLSCGSEESIVTESSAPDPHSVVPQNVAIEHMDKLLKCFLDILISTSLPRLKTAVAKMMDDLLLQQLGCDFVRVGLQDRVTPLLRSAATKLHEALTVKHCDSWILLLGLISRLLRVWPSVFGLTSTASNLPYTLIQHVVKLRDSFADEQENVTNLLQVSAAHSSGSPADLSHLSASIVDELNRTCLVALESLGPECIFSNELLSIDPIIEELERGKITPQRVWLLPLLARVQCTHPCRLSFFSHTLLPLADRALAAITKAAASKSSGPSHTAFITAGITMVKQLWAGLAMCVRHSPPDWSELSTGGLGRRLISELISTPALRPTILLAFRRLSMLAQHTEEGLTTMRKGAKLAVPAMLSLYENADLSTESALRQQIRATLNSYLPCLTYTMVSVPAKLALQKLVATQNPVYLEILQILVPHTNKDEINSFLTSLREYFTSPLRVLQKRAYRLLEQICCGSTPSSKEYLKEHLNQLLYWLHALAVTDQGSSIIGAPATMLPSENLSEPSVGTDLSGHLSKLSVSSLDAGTSSYSVTNKKARLKVPWKPRIRCLYHLLNEVISIDSDVISDSSEAAYGSGVRDFANMFLPEILAAVCEANRVVRVLVYRLVVQLTLAFAGRSSNEVSFKVSLPDVGSEVFHSTYRCKQPLPSDDELDVDSSNDSGDASVGRASSLDRFTCADGDDLRSTKSVRGPAHWSICSALHLILSRLLSCLPPHASLASNRVELVAQESAGRVVCHLLQHLKFRRSILLTLESDDSESAQARVHASTILTNAHLTMQQLIRSPERQFARLGLQLARLLLAFIGFSSLCLTDLVQSVQSLHPTQKRPLRFAVKTILEKMVKRFGRKTIQGMTTPEYAKVVRNSARKMARLERRRTEPFAKSKRTTSTDDDGSSASKSITSAATSYRSGVRSISGRSQLSLPPRIHIPCFEELLAASSDEEIPVHVRKTSTRSVSSNKKSRESVSSALRPKSLADELESLAKTAGLCQRSRKRMLHGRDPTNVSDLSGDDDDEIDNRRTVKKGIRREVRFADTTTVACSSARSKKRLRTLPENSEESDMWLIEQPDTDDIVDLSDPKALARHTAFTVNADSTALSRNALQTNKVKRSVSTPFPIVDGKILIDVGGKNVREAKQKTDWDVISSNDEDDNMKTVGTWSAPKASVKSRSRQLMLKSIPGQVYASNKARGDMRRAGQPEPYAYVSLGSGLGVHGKTSSAADRRRLLKAVGIGKHKRNKLSTGSGPVLKGKKIKHKKS